MHKPSVAPILKTPFHGQERYWRRRIFNLALKAKQNNVNKKIPNMDKGINQEDFIEDQHIDTADT